MPWLAALAVMGNRMRSKSSVRVDDLLRRHALRWAASMRAAFVNPAAAIDRAGW
jgi:hypothetical protein